MAWSMLMEPLRACAPRSAKSIQPALNPSIICMRGVGFFMPWARKIDSTVRAARPQHALVSRR
jgi:hypothetical protein